MYYKWKLACITPGIPRSNFRSLYLEIRGEEILICDIPRWMEDVCESRQISQQVFVRRTMFSLQQSDKLYESNVGVWGKRASATNRPLRHYFHPATKTLLLFCLWLLFLTIKCSPHMLLAYSLLQWNKLLLVSEVNLFSVLQYFLNTKYI